MRRDQRKDRRRATPRDADPPPQPPIRYPTRYPQSRAIDLPPPRRRDPPWPDQATLLHRDRDDHWPSDLATSHPDGPRGLIRPDLPRTVRAADVVLGSADGDGECLKYPRYCGVAQETDPDQRPTPFVFNSAHGLSASPETRVNPDAPARCSRRRGVSLAPSRAPSIPSCRRPRSTPPESAHQAPNCRP